MQTLPEPWLRGPIAGVNPLVAPILYAFQQAREDLAFHTRALTTAQLWAAPFGFASVGFHLRHIAGSTDRLTTYLENNQLTGTQLAALKSEHEPGASRETLLSELDSAFQRSEQVVRSL